MIDVVIIENNGLVALCKISGPGNEFRKDLARIKTIPFEDREWCPEEEKKYFRVRYAEKYDKWIVEIGDAIRLYRRQLRMF